MMRMLAAWGALFSLALVAPASAAFVPIDSYNNSDSELGTRGTTSGFFGISSGVAVFLEASSTGGLVSIGYNFATPLQGSGDGLVLRLTNLNIGQKYGTTAEAFAEVTLRSGTQEYTLPAQSLGNAEGDLGDVLFDFRTIVEDANEADFAQISIHSTGPFTLYVDSFDYDFIDVQSVPEPTTWALIGLIGAGGGAASWRNRRKRRG